MKRRHFLTAGLLAVTGAVYGLGSRSQAAIGGLKRMPARPKIVPPAELPTLIDLVNGTSQSFLVAHGKGSDLAHTGWLQKFSNIPGSEATSGGSYITSETYIGKHGRSRRLIGLDSSNDMAEARAIVIHGAWYAEPEMISAHGKLGRSQGCFAFSESDLETILERLGQGRLLYADRA